MNYKNPDRYNNHQFLMTKLSDLLNEDDISMLKQFTLVRDCYIKDLNVEELLDLTFLDKFKQTFSHPYNTLNDLYIIFVEKREKLLNS